MASESGAISRITSNTYIRCNIAPVTGKLEVYVVNRDEKEARTPLAQNRILIEFHTIARVVVSPKATDNTTSVFFYLDDRPTPSQELEENDVERAIRAGLTRRQLTSCSAGCTCPRANSASGIQSILCCKCQTCVKEVAGCWLVPVFEVRVESAEAAKSALPSFPQKWDEERKLRAKERLDAAGIGVYPASTKDKSKFDILCHKFLLAWAFCQFGSKSDCSDEEISKETTEICMQCDCKVCVRAYHFEINPNGSR